MRSLTSKRHHKAARLALVAAALLLTGGLYALVAPSASVAAPNTEETVARGEALFAVSCASCHGEAGKRIRLQDLPDLRKAPGDGIGFAAWPAYRVSNGQMWTMQHRLNDCYRQQRFPEPDFASDVTVALGVYLGVNAKGNKSAVPTIKR